MAETTVADKLCNASAQGNLPEVQMLLQNGADVNGFNRYTRTPLQVAKMGSTATVKALLGAGAQPNIRDPVLNLTVTHDAARAGFVDAVRLLLEFGADINLVDGKGNLPLHLAAREGHLEVVQLLIGRTANPRMVNSQGHSAGELARLHGKKSTAEYINEYLSSH